MLWRRDAHRYPAWIGAQINAVAERASSTGIMRASHTKRKRKSETRIGLIKASKQCWMPPMAQQRVVSQITVRHVAHRRTFDAEQCSMHRPGADLPHFSPFLSFSSFLSQSVSSCTRVQDDYVRFRHFLTPQSFHIIFIF